MFVICSDTLGGDGGYAVGNRVKCTTQFTMINQLHNLVNKTVSRSFLLPTALFRAGAREHGATVFRVFFRRRLKQWTVGLSGSWKFRFF